MSPRAPDRSALPTLVAALLLSGAFVFLALAVGRGAPPRVDLALLLALREPAGPPLCELWLQTVARDLTALGSGSVLTVGVLLVLGYLALGRRWSDAGFLLFSTIGGAVVVTLIKFAVGRARPEVLPHLATALGPSFPSGHAFQSAVVYLTFAALLCRATAARRTRAFFFTAAIMVSALVGLTRVYLGVHFPSDVLGGWLGGFAWVLWVSLLPRLAPQLRRS